MERMTAERVDEMARVMFEGYCRWFKRHFGEPCILDWEGLAPHERDEYRTVAEMVAEWLEKSGAIRQDKRP